MWLIIDLCSVLQHAHAHTGSQTECFYAELMTCFTEDSNGTFSSEAKIFRRDSSQSREYFTVNLDTSDVRSYTRRAFKLLCPDFSAMSFSGTPVLWKKGPSTPSESCLAH